MATITAIFKESGRKDRQRRQHDLRRVAEEFIRIHGGLSLGHIDTPAFIRKTANISLKNRQGNWKREILVKPEEKVVRFLAILKGNLPLAG